jgi:hypothetical protein
MISFQGKLWSGSDDTTIKIWDGNVKNLKFKWRNYFLVDGKDA